MGGIKVIWNPWKRIKFLNEELTREQSWQEGQTRAREVEQQQWATERAGLRDAKRRAERQLREEQAINQAKGNVEEGVTMGVYTTNAFDIVEIPPEIRDAGMGGDTQVRWALAKAARVGVSLGERGREIVNVWRTEGQRYVIEHRAVLDGPHGTDELPVPGNDLVSGGSEHA